jgi:hypothetical protein
MRLASWAFGLGWLGLSAGIIGAAGAQEKDKEAPPAKKAKADVIPGTFRLYVVSDKRYDPKDELNRTGKLHDPVGEHGLAPVLAVFSRSVPDKADDPLVALLQAQDRLAQKYRALRLGAFAAFLTLTRDFPEAQDRDEKIAAVANLARSANVANVTIGLAEAATEENGKVGPSPQVEAWKIGAEDDVTVVFYYRFEVVGRWAFPKDKPPTPADIDAIAAAVDKLLAPKIGLKGAPKKK